MNNLDTSKKNFITVLCEDNDYGKAALAHARKLCQVFNAELLEYSIVKSLKSKAVCKFNEENNSMLMVFGISSKSSFFTPRKALHWIQHSRIPCLCTSCFEPEPEAYKHVILPLNVRKQDKEKALWAGYFNRFYQSTVHILYRRYKDAFLRQNIHDNLLFTEKLYANLNVNYQVHCVDSTDENIDSFAFTYAPQLNATLTVVMMTNYYNVADLIFGPQELGVLKKIKKVPVLCLNERDDLYVLCT